MSAGGVYLTTASTVRVWYWDGYYEQEYRRVMDEKWATMQEFGFDPDFDYTDYGNEDASGQIDFLL